MTTHTTFLSKTRKSELNYDKHTTLIIISRHLRDIDISIEHPNYCIQSNIFCYHLATKSLNLNFKAITLLRPSSRLQQSSLSLCPHSFSALGPVHSPCCLVRPPSLCTGRPLCNPSSSVAILVCHLPSSAWFPSLPSFTWLPVALWSRPVPILVPRHPRLVRVRQRII